MFKTRILKVIAADDSVVYKAQYRVFGVWVDFDTDDIGFIDVLLIFAKCMLDKDAPTPFSTWIKSSYNCKSSDFDDVYALIEEYKELYERHCKNTAKKKIKLTKVVVSKDD